MKMIFFCGGARGIEMLFSDDGLREKMRNAGMGKGSCSEEINL